MISVMWRHLKIWIFLVLASQVFFLTACRASYDSCESTVLFSACEGDFNPVGTEKSESPNLTFTVEYAWEDPDTSGQNALFIIYKKTDSKFLIGRSDRGIKFYWVSTRIGNLLVVKNLIDTHHDESFVLWPHIDSNGEVKVSKLYATPDQDYIGNDFPPEHIYTEIKKIRYDGMMTINIQWDFTPNDLRNVTTEIPLFY